MDMYINFCPSQSLSYIVHHLVNMCSLCDSSHQLLQKTNLKTLMLKPGEEGNTRATQG